MSEQIKHECGLGFIRLLKPISYYHEKYGSALYGLNKLQLLLQKQRNRGQDGAGLATIKLDMPPGHRYISRRRTNSSTYLRDLFEGAFAHFNDVPPNLMNDPEWLKLNKPYTGELLLGHLRYGTHGDNTIETVHPFLRQSNWITRNLVLAGNFNLTNVDELFKELVELGQYPKEKSDTVTVLEKMGHFLDDEVQRLFTWFKPDGHSNREINELIFKHLDIQRFLKRASRKFDGGFVMAGMIGHGDAFVMRDPSGIRPAYYYIDEEVVAVASERPAIQTAFNVRYDSIRELRRGHALIVKKDGRISEKPYIQEKERKACSFERIYFSRGTDRDIYLERKKLGENLVDQIMEAIAGDVENTVFSFIPNTAETAFFGMIEGVEDRLNKIKLRKIKELGSDADAKEIEKILSVKPRSEKIIVKDAKLRTFIADEVVRGDLVSHVYDVTYGIVRNGIDTLVLMDDSIVRGTTMKDSIIRMAARLLPKRIIVVSSAPQIRYPDCYGIDMSRMNEFVAFRAMVELLRESGREFLLDEVYQQCKVYEESAAEDIENYVSKLYEPFTREQISAKIAELLTPPDVDIPVDVIYQSLEGLHNACPNHNGDWYFSGEYPTYGGNRVVNKAFVHFMEKKNVRAY
jgi:amidophosphoribosyltransferase